MLSILIYCLKPYCISLFNTKGLQKVKKDFTKNMSYSIIVFCKKDMWKWLNGSSSNSYLKNIYLPRIYKYMFFILAVTTISKCNMGLSLYQMHRKGQHIKFRPPRQPLDGKPFAKGVILKTLIKKPKKPNSANRKCVLVRLSTGKEMVAYVPGIGHNLQEHNVVLCRVGRLRDTPGVKIKCVRGAYDLPHVIKQTAK